MLVAISVQSPFPRPEISSSGISQLGVVSNVSIRKIIFILRKIHYICAAFWAFEERSAKKQQLLVQWGLVRASGPRLSNTF